MEIATILQGQAFIPIILLNNKLLTLFVFVFWMAFCFSLKNGKLKYYKVVNPLDQHLTKIKGFTEALRVNVTSGSYLYKGNIRTNRAAYCYDITVLFPFNNLYIQIDDERFWLKPELLQKTRVYGADSY